MQQSRSPKEETQCPVCYEQGRELKEVCGNKHKICVKCLFNLIKRQCPICKTHFRIDWREGNGTNYHIVFGEEDRDHNEMEEDNNEEQETIRNYVRFLQQYEQYRQNLYQHQLYHHYYHNTYPQPYPTHHTTPSYNNNQYPLFSNPHVHQNHQQNIRSPVTQNISQNYQTEANMRNPEYRQHMNERVRRERRARDQRMYGQTVRVQALAGVQAQSQAKEESCGLFDKLGQFFISIGEKLSNKKPQPASRNNQPCSSQPLYSTQNNVYHQQNNRPLNIRSSIPTSQQHHYPYHHYYHHSNTHHYAPYTPQNHHHEGCPHHHYYGTNHNLYHQYPPTNQYQHSHQICLQNAQHRH